MMLRNRHVELDKFRTIDPRYNHAWIMFFGTCPPGINEHGVRFTDRERHALANDLPIPVDGSQIVDVEPYDGYIHNRW